MRSVGGFPDWSWCFKFLSVLWHCLLCERKASCLWKPLLPHVHFWNKQRKTKAELANPGSPQTTTTTTIATTTTTTVLWPFVQDYPGELVPEETFTTFCISILPVQFASLTVFLHNLSPSPLWSTSWSATLHFILHTFLHPNIVLLSQHMSIQSQPVLYEDYVIYS